MRLFTFISGSENIRNHDFDKKTTIEAISVNAAARVFPVATDPGIKLPSYPCLLYTSDAADE